jgi:hypothetical protein
MFIETVRDLFKILEDIKDAKDLKKKADAFAKMGDAVLVFSKNLAWSGFYLQIAQKLNAEKLLMTSVNKLKSTFEDLGSNKKIKKGAETLELMGTSLQEFAKGLVYAAVASVVGILFTPIIAAAIGIMGFVFAKVGNYDKKIKKGAKVIDKMGDAMKSFAIGLAFFALTTAVILMKPVILVAMVASIVLIAGAFSLIGSKKMSKNIKKGALSMVLIGASLVVFSIGLLIFSAATKGMGFMDVLIQSAVILGIGVATALVGKFGLSNIAQGALSLALNGIGLLVFSLGYVPFAEATKGIGLTDILV